MDQLLLWGFGLLAAATLLFVIELLVPTGGIVGLIGLAALVASIVSFWRVDMAWGIASTLGVLILGPVAMVYAFKIWPHTPVGRRMMLSEDEETTRLKEEERRRLKDAAEAIVGATGEAITDLRPIGSARIEGERVEVSAESGAISAGARIRVVSVEGNRIKVRQVN